jgi:hypothetical protein
MVEGRCRPTWRECKGSRVDESQQIRVDRVPLSDRHTVPESAYVFRVPFCTISTARGPEVA